MEKTYTTPEIEITLFRTQESVAELSGAGELIDDQEWGPLTPVG